MGIPIEVIFASVLGVFAFGKIVQGMGFEDWGSSWFSWGDVVVSGLLGFVASAAIIGILGFLPALLIGAQTSLTDCVNPQNTALVNISDGASPTGAFFLGSGYVGSDLYYYYYYQLPDGGYQGASIDSNIAEVKYLGPGDGSPHMVTYTPQLRAPWSYFGIENSQVCTSIFYVPQGSIKQNYQLGK